VSACLPYHLEGHLVRLRCGSSGGGGLAWSFCGGGGGLWGSSLLFSCVFLIVGTDFIYFAPVIHVTERIFDVAYKKHLG
jgi:hypothetical protein